MQEGDQSAAWKQMQPSHRHISAPLLCIIHLFTIHSCRIVEDHAELNKEQGEEEEQTETEFMVTLHTDVSPFCEFNMTQSSSYRP